MLLMVALSKLTCNYYGSVSKLENSVESETAWSSPSFAIGFVSGWFQSMDLSQCPRNLVAFSNPSGTARWTLASCWSQNSSLNEPINYSFIRNINMNVLCLLNWWNKRLICYLVSNFMLETEVLETNTVLRSDLGVTSQLQFFSCFIEIFKVLKMC